VAGFLVRFALFLVATGAAIVGLAFWYSGPYDPDRVGWATFASVGITGMLAIAVWTVWLHRRLPTGSTDGEALGSSTVIRVTFTCEASAVEWRQSRPA
jgi:hypothetical protein